MLARVLAVVVCLSVCLSVTRRYCVETAKCSITQTAPLDSPGTLVFWRRQSLMRDPHTSLNLRSKWPTPFRAPQFRPISAHSASTVRDDEKSSISTDRKSTTRFPTSHRWPAYVPKSPKEWHKTRYCCFFASKIQLLSKEVCYKFSLCETL